MAKRQVIIKLGNGCYLISPLVFHHSVPLPHNGKEGLLLVRPVNLGRDLVLLIAVEWFGDELDGAVVAGLRARYRHRPAQLDPGHGQYGTAVAVGECEIVLLVVVQHGHDALADVVHADGQAEEFGFGVDVCVEAYPLVVVLRVECRN